jgi:hypothetical protein
MSSSTSLFWLAFRRNKDVNVLIQPAVSLVMARLKALLSGIEGEFTQGHLLEDKIAKKIPKGMIGRILSRKEATALLEKLG